MTRPLVSIVTPSYNQAAYLEETIRSVVEQDYEPLEYLIVDDGSTDGSVEIIRRYGDRLAWWTTQENAGQAATVNRGLARAQGEVLGFLSSDDVLLPGGVARLVAALEANPNAVLAYGDAYYLDEHSRRTGMVPASDWDPARYARTGRQPIPQPAALFTRRGWDLAGPLNERAWALFDSELFLRLSTVGDIVRIREPVAAFRLHPESKQLSRRERMAEECVRYADEFFGGDALPPELRPIARKARATFYRRGALAWYAAGEIRRARRLFLRSLVLSPQGMRRKQLVRLVRTLLPERVVRRRRERRA
jgi:glycosyltransferase involved in cell wall biosynthesis